MSDKNPKTDICPKVGLNYIQTMLETMVYNVWVTGCSSVRCINVCLLVYHVIRRNTRQDGSPGFVPVKEVERVWRTLKSLIPADMVSFISYFESTWVGTSTTSPLFSHDMWNQHDASLMLIPRRRVASWVPLNAVMFQPYTLEVSGRP